MPKQCCFVSTARPSLQQELSACVDVHQRNALIALLNHRNSAHPACNNNNATSTAATTRYAQNNNRHNSLNRSGEENRDWVRVVSLHRSAALRNNNNSNNSNSGDSGGINSVLAGAAEEFSFGRLMAVTSVPITAPPVDYHTINNNANNTFHTTTTATAATAATSLVDMWRQGGFNYSTLEASNIVQILVEFPAPSNAQNNAQNTTPMCFAYPADKVFRTQAPMQGDSTEVAHISQSLSPDWIVTALTTTAPTPATTATTEEKGVAAIGDTKPLYTTVNPRDGFTAIDGYVLLAADYSQVELRILAHFSADAGLLEAFHAQVDVFRAIAAKWLHKATIEEVTEAERHQVKQICYALIYGAGPALVAQQAHVSVETAQSMMKDFLRTYPGVETFLLHTKKRCRKQGFVETLLGRRRILPDIRSADNKKRSKAERQAVNTLCQGSAADLIKVSLFSLVPYIITYYAVYSVDE